MPSILPKISFSIFFSFFISCQKKHKLKKGHKPAPGSGKIWPKIDQQFARYSIIVFMDSNKQWKNKSYPADGTGTSQSVKPWCNKLSNYSAADKL